jgi:esterase/lipase superfamily enzyme
LQATTTAPDALRSCSPSQEIFSNQDAFFAHLEAAVHESKTQQVLLFVHGFNVDLASATEKAAVLRIGTGFDGVVVAYSWPSAGKLLHYYYDQENNEWTIPHLRDFIAQLGQHVPEKHLHILAHSMGSRALIHALYSMPNPPEFGQLLLAAPDIDSGVFEDMVRSLRTFDGKTIYVSNHDKALKASRKLHGDYPRLGDSKNTHYISRDAGIEVVDVSALKGDITGHLYYSGQPLVLGDIGHILQGKGSAAQECGPSKKPKSIRELCRITTRTESQK